MDSGTNKVLSKVLSRRELDKIPNESVTKIEKYFDERFEDFLTSQALHESSQREHDKKMHVYEKLVQELTTKNEDCEVKLEASQQNTVELRKQLDATRADVNRYQATINKLEADNLDFRRQRDNLTNERDSLQSTLESRCTEIERLKRDVQELDKQLKAAINAKYDAIAKYDEIQAKEASLEYKERRMEQDRSILQSQLQSLTESYNSNSEELMATKREKQLIRLDLETKITEKNEELSIANSTIAHLQESNQTLLNRIEELSAKRKDEADEAMKMIDCYKNELLAKTKLADIYRVESDDHRSQVSQLTQAITDLKKMLNESVEEYGELETKYKETALQHAKDLEEKDSIIESLKTELKNANELLKAAQDENLDQVVERVAPSAAAATKLIKSGMTLTEIYTMYVKTSENLRLQERENAKQQIQLNEILKEIQERAPAIDKRNIEYDKLIEANAQIREQLDNLITERVIEREQLQETTSKYAFLERENKRLKTIQADLARQVCFLVKEVEQIRGGLVCEGNDVTTLGADMTAGEVITKKLVTFKNVDELHENNQKLLLLVRDLSTKLEEFEESQFDQLAHKKEVDEYMKRLNNMELTNRHQSQMIQTYIQQRDRYKLLYYEIMKDVGKPVSGMCLDGSLSVENMEGVDEETPLASTSSVSSGGGGGTPSAGGSAPAAAAAAANAADKRIVAELQEKVKETTKALQQLKAEYEEYRKEKLANDRVLNEQFNTMRDEVRELTTTNCKLKNSYEYKLEQLKSFEKNEAMLKRQISALEERNRVYDTAIAKHEATQTYLHEQLMNTQKQLSSAEIANKNLKHQCDILRDAENRLQSERDALYRERQTHNVVLNNLEIIKNQFERSESEGRLRNEQRFEETLRECSALRRHLQEEQDRFRELSADLKRRTETAVDLAATEKAEAEKLQLEVQQMRAELNEKSDLNESLSSKLQEALTPNKADNPVAKANKRAKELQHKLDLSTVEIDHLRKEFETCQTTIEQYSKIAKESESQLKDLNDRYTEYRTKTEKELHELKANETDLQSRVAELETEIKLQITDAKLSNSDNSEQLTKAQLELKEAYQKISENNTTIRDLREQVNLLTAEVKTVNEKYTKAMMLHTSDLQAYTVCKDQLNQIHEQTEKLKAERDQSVSALKDIQEGADTRLNLLAKEKEELERRLNDLTTQNAALLDQLQSLSSTVSACRANESANDSAGEISFNDSICNRSINEGDGRDQLMTIIKYLRSEKDVALANVDVLRNENVRISSEMRILKDKLQELTEASNQASAASQENPLTTAKYQEVLRKLETLNAVTDSNRMLRDERDQLQQRIREITARNTKVEQEMFPLKEKNRELNTRTDELTSESAKLRHEANQWRQRANALVERSNKNPEDFKRLQNERENLAKMLTAEKEKIERFETELASIRQEKSRVDAELAALTKTNQTLIEEKRKLAEEILTLKQSNGRISHEIIEVKSKLLQRDDDIKKMVEELTAKELQLTDSRNKEIQIRKIAKKYKDSFFDLQNKEDERKAEQAARPIEQQAADVNEAGQSRAQAEKSLNDRIKELDNSVTEKLEENDLLRAETESLNKKLKEREDAHSNILKELNHTIVTLTEEKKTITRELALTKTSLLNCEASRTEHDTLKVQNESRITRLEKELADLDKENKEAVARLSRENETLQQRLANLRSQLQQGIKPTTSTSVIEKSPSDPARTANVKPMAGPSTQQSAAVTPRRGGDTPLASIRPMSVQNSRTAAVLPTSQTSSNIAAVHGTSITAITPSTSERNGEKRRETDRNSPPHQTATQQVHTTGMTGGEVMSTTSSHTDYMPATSSAAAIVIVAVPPMGSGSAENIQEAESVEDSSSSSSSTQIVIQQQTVALVSPRQHENTPQNIVAPQQVIIDHLHATASTSASSSTSTSDQSSITMSTHNRATSTSNTVTTSQAGHKRPRETETDSSEDVSSDRSNIKKPQTKRTRIQIGSSSQGVSESSCGEVEYQVPTSSQRDQDDDNIIVVDSGEDDEMPDDEGPVEPDDAPFEDDGDNVEQFDIEDGYGQAQGVAYEGETADIYVENMQSDTNEVDVEDSSEIPNQSENQAAGVASDVGTSQAIGQSSTSAASSNTANLDDANNTDTTDPQQPQENQQIQTISSGSDAGSSTQISTAETSPWRQTAATPMRQHQNSTQQGQTPQQNLGGLGYEESGDDSIVPSTPTLYVPRRADGFSEAVSSPHLQVAARFTYESGTRTNLTSDGIDDTSVDLMQLDESVASGVPTVPPSANLTEPDAAGPSGTATTAPSVADIEPIPGTSAGEASVPDIVIDAEDNASTTETDEKQTSEDIEDIDEEEGTDGVSSEGEKTGGNDSLQTEEEGREAEATQAPSINTRSRGGARGVSPMYQRRGRRGRPQPIVWQEGSRSPMRPEFQQQQQQQHTGSPNRSFSPQSPAQAQRGLRNRRANMRPQFSRY